MYPPPQSYTERLIIRPLTPDDTEAWRPFVEHPETMRFLRTFFPDSIVDKAQHWMEFTFKRYAENRYGLLALEDKETGAFIGQCGLLSQVVDDVPELEVGYHILQQYWGKGYAPEAAKFFIDYAFENNLAESIISVIDIENYNSQRVAEKNGLRREKQTVQLGDDVFIYRINKPH